MHEQAGSCQSALRRRAMCYQGKVVLITGASSGIGATCAIRFAKSSASLALVGRNLDNLTKVANQCRKLNHIKHLLVVADLTSDEDQQRIVNETINEYGKIDVLVNNAGINSVSMELTPAEAYDRVMATNLRATYLFTARVIPHLLKTKGNIVNISSILSNKPMPLMTPYCMSKAALDMFTKCSAVQLGPAGVRVNAVNPGPVKTPLFTRAGMTEADCNKLFAAVESCAPLRKIIKGEDVAELVVFLASDRASCINGSCYVIDCGLTLGDAGHS